MKFVIFPLKLSSMFVDSGWIPTVSGVTWSWIVMSSRFIKTSWVVTPFEGITSWRKLAYWLAFGGGTRSVAFNESSLGTPVFSLRNSAFKVSAVEECSTTVVKCYWKKKTRILSNNKPCTENNTHFIVIF